MGLIKDAELPSGLTVNGAYWRINLISGNKENLFVYVTSYVTKEDYTNGKTCLEQESYSFIPNVEDGSTNFIKQGYEYLKTLPEFVGAIDD